MKKNFCRTSGTSEKQFSELESKNVFGTRLRTLRVERGYTLDEARKKLEGTVKSSILGKYERGDRYPKFDTLKSLAELYDVDVDYLAGTAKAKRLSVFQHSDSFEITEEEENLIKQFARIDQYKKALIFDAFNIYGGKQDEKKQ